MDSTEMTLCETEHDLILHIQDRCGLSRDNSQWFMRILERDEHIRHRNKATYNFEILIPDDWAKLYLDNGGKEE